MVKAGVYLVARLAPAFADVPVWKPVVLVLGGATMLLGGWRALRLNDLKLVLAYGTVSQLGFLTLLAGTGNHDAALAAFAMILAHALFKAPLFLVTGIVDHATGTRDLRKLSESDVRCRTSPGSRPCPPPPWPPCRPCSASPRRRPPSRRCSTDPPPTGGRWSPWSRAPR